MWIYSHCKPFVEEIIFSPLNFSGTFFKNQFTIKIRLYFWTIDSVSLICMSSLMVVPHYLDYCTFVVTLKSESLTPLTLFFFFKIILAISSPLDFHMHF